MGGSGKVPPPPPSALRGSFLDAVNEIVDERRAVIKKCTWSGKQRGINSDGVEVEFYLHVNEAGKVRNAIITRNEHRLDKDEQYMYNLLIDEIMWFGERIIQGDIVQLHQIKPDLNFIFRFVHLFF